MTLSLRIASALFAAALVAPATAAVTLFTDSGSFGAALTGGSFTEGFTGLSASPPASYGDATFSFGASATGGLFSLGTDLSTNDADDELLFTFVGGNVYGVGGNFYATDFDGDFFGAQVDIELSTGDSLSFTPAAMSDFRGFLSDTPISWLKLSHGGQQGLYAAADNLTVGNVERRDPPPQPAPEPATLALAGLGIAGLIARSRRRT